MAVSLTASAKVVPSFTFTRFDDYTLLVVAAKRAAAWGGAVR
jgi:hypothetical protein